MTTVIVSEDGEVRKPLAVVFSGAGLSAESGIPTFRDSNGLWENHRVEDVASPEGWERDKQTVLDFYAQRYHSVKSAEPNAAHLAIAKLQEKFNVVNITQNIDDLLERAGCTNIRHIHGSINFKKCEWHNNTVVLDGDTRYTCDYRTEMTAPIEMGDLCPKCGGQMRPDVVWFGEVVDMPYNAMEELVREVKYNNGVFICVGTSAQVYPAGYLISFFSQVKRKYIVDMKPQRVCDYVLLKGKAGEQLPILVEQLLTEESQAAQGVAVRPSADRLWADLVAQAQAAALPSEDRVVEEGLAWEGLVDSVVDSVGEAQPSEVQSSADQPVREVSFHEALWAPALAEMDQELLAELAAWFEGSAVPEAAPAAAEFVVEYEDDLLADLLSDAHSVDDSGADEAAAPVDTSAAEASDDVAAAPVDTSAGDADADRAADV